ncbi:MAG: ABC transporter ATP-binding protein, partial [Clostridiales bacterium]|nr:ABC transporter ATP-binding protein [Clostridiales bacterium]
MLELSHVFCQYAGREVLRDVTLSFPPGQVLGLVGPNGSGKSTLLKTALGIQPKSGGTITLDGVPLEQLRPKEIARQVSYLPQFRSVPDITAWRLVLHGRFPHLGYPRRYRQADYDAVSRALEAAGALPLADRFLGTLSGGQRQKVYLAMALA